MCLKKNNKPGPVTDPTILKEFFLWLCCGSDFSDYRNLSVSTVRSAEARGHQGHVPQKFFVNDIIYRSIVPITIFFLYDGTWEQRYSFDFCCQFRIWILIPVLFIYFYLKIPWSLIMKIRYRFDTSVHQYSLTEILVPVSND